MMRRRRRRGSKELVSAVAGDRRCQKGYGEGVCLNSEGVETISEFLWSHETPDRKRCATRHGVDSSCHYPFTQVGCSFFSRGLMSGSQFLRWSMLFDCPIPDYRLPIKRS
jgi:hypothetical protein